MEEAFRFIRNGDTQLDPTTLPEDLNAVHRSMTLLHTAAAVNNVAVVKQLIAIRGFDAGFATEEGFTALHWAAMRAFPDVVELLLDAGAPVDPLTVMDHTPLLLSVSRIPRDDRDDAQQEYVRNLQKCMNLLMGRGARLDYVAQKKRLDLKVSISTAAGKLEPASLILQRLAQ